MSFRGQDYAVSARTVDEAAIGTRVHLTCEAIDKTTVMELQISPRGDWLSIWWNDGGGRQRCVPWELDVWPRRRMV